MDLRGTESVILANNENRQLLLSRDHCDKYDYLTAVGCGVLGGVIDIFLVGFPGESAIGNWSDAMTGKAVLAFAKRAGWTPRAGKEGNVASAIGYLERNYRVNYDQATTAATNGAIELWTKNHHMKSLAHSPDVIGLFFSILNQFTSTSSFLDRGQLITIQTDTYQLQGGNFIAKLFCGTVNWFGHLMSDIAGSSGSRGNTGRGTGIVAPFYELFGLCSFGKFRVDKDLQDLATIANRAFQKGYDLRFSVAAAVPVVITNLLIRLIWAFRRRFQYQLPLNECVPLGTERQDSLRIMLLIGNGTLCVMDLADAGLRSGGNFLAFFMRLNLFAWYRFAMLALKELMLRVKINDPFQATIDALVRLNAALQEYLSQLERIDYQKFQEETERYQELVSLIEGASTEKELNGTLLRGFEKLGIEKPWKGDFDDFMGDDSQHLVFT